MSVTPPSVLLCTGARATSPSVSRRSTSWAYRGCRSKLSGSSSWRISMPWSGPSHPSLGCMVGSGTGKDSHLTRRTRSYRTIFAFLSCVHIDCICKIHNRCGIYVCPCSPANTICHHHTHHICWHVSNVLICTMMIYIHRRTGLVNPMRSEGNAEGQDLRPEPERRLVQSIRANRQVGPRNQVQRMLRRTM